MFAHLRACLSLLLLTVILCAILYPLVLLGIGQGLLRDKAKGSLITDENGNVIGSRLIAQDFKGDEYFQPRPSAASFNGAASSGSNLGANNPALRERVAKDLGPVVRYGPKSTRPGERVGPDVEKWARANHAEDVAKLEPTEIQRNFFAAWRQAHPDIDLEAVPADMVMTSGSGLDPHITLANAQYQGKHRVAAAWAERIAKEKNLPEARRDELRQQFQDELLNLLEKHASAPLGGMAGVPLVNVLEVNLAVRDTMKRLADTIR